MVVGEAVMLEYKMAKGETLNYFTSVSTEQEIKTSDQSAKFVSDVDMKMSQHCTDVASDGVMTVDVTVESGKMTKDGEVSDLPNIGQTITIKMRKSGQIIHTSVDMPFEQPSFPTKPIKIGETWNADSKIAVPGRADMETLHYTYTLAGTKQVSGYECLEIQIVCPDTKIPVQEGIDQVLNSKGVTYFAYKEGRLIKSDIGTKTVINTPDGTFHTDVRVIVELESRKEDNLSGSDGFFIK